jgi:AcrR family transcriptional regulator
VGRPRLHDERTRAALIAAAERLVAEGGPDALSLRAVASEAATTTRAVYSLFESKDGLVAALAERAFELLHARVKGVPERDDPAVDLIEAGVQGFRPFVREHPALFRIAFQRIVPGLQAPPELTAARGRALALLTAKVERLEVAGLLGGKSVPEAAVEFNAMCEGLANAELRGPTLRILPEGEEERAWRDGLSTVVRGFRAPQDRSSRGPSQSSSTRGR